MAFTRYLAPALAIVSTAAAATCSIAATATSTITNPAGVASLVQCATYSGNILMQTGAPNAGIIDLSGIKEIDGSLTYTNDSTVTELSAGDLKKISGTIELGGLNSLGDLDLSDLQTMGGLNLNTLGSLNALGLGTPSSCGDVSIIDTRITEMTGLSDCAQFNSLTVSNNVLLSDITLNVSSIKSNIDIGSNDMANGGQNVAFANLVTASGDLIIRNSTTVSMPKLTTVEGSLQFIGNLFQTLNLTTLVTTGALVIDDNSHMTNISLPSLVNINGTANGNFEIANNTVLTDVTGFPKLGQVSGGFTIEGEFDTIELPSSLTRVGGAMNVQTTSTKFDCDPINGLSSNGGSQVVAGAVSCSSAVATPGTGTGGSGTSGSGTSSGAPNSSSSGAAVPMNAPAYIGAATFGGALLQFLMSF